jgi:peptidoglycan hydrolase CwlO-like protein
MNDQQAKIDGLSSENDLLRSKIDNIISDILKLDASNFEIDSLKANMANLSRGIDDLKNNLNRVKL